MASTRMTHARHHAPRKVSVWGGRFRDADAFSPATLLERRRAEDDDGTLFAAFNAIQENTTKGGMRGINAAGRRMLSQPLSGIDSDATYNARLWQLTEEYAEAIA